MSTPAEALEQATQPRPIEEIREAMHRIHRAATRQSTEAYMSIPPDPKRDADLILSAAIDELEQLRAQAATTHRTVWRYSEPSRNGEGWWIAFLDDAGCLSVQSDYGDHSHRWPMGGMPMLPSGRRKDLREFLVTCDRYYILTKLAGRGEWVDVEASVRKIRAALVAYRKEHRGVSLPHYVSKYDWRTERTTSKPDGRTVKEAVREAWDALDRISEGHELQQILYGGELAEFVGEGPDAGDFYITDHTPQTRGFMDKIWPRIVEALRADLGMPAAEENGAHP